MSNSNKSRLPKFQALKTKREKQKMTKKGSNIQIKQICSMISTWMMKNYFNKKRIVSSPWLSGSFYTSTILRRQMWQGSKPEKRFDYWPTKKCFKLSRCSVIKNFAPHRNKSKVALTLSEVNLWLGTIFFHIITSDKNNNSNNNISWALRNLPFSNFCRSK